VGTGDLSEMALGWCTYNGDHMSRYCVNAGVPKTLIGHIVRFAAGTLGGKALGVLTRIANTCASPELLPPDKEGKRIQITENEIGPYELHVPFYKVWNKSAKTVLFGVYCVFR
jgi:NAD+ synthase (glutamine-hydrolysing)